MTIWRIACWAPKATGAPQSYIIPTLTVLLNVFLDDLCHLEFEETMEGVLNFGHLCYNDAVCTLAGA